MSSLLSHVVRQKERSRSAAFPSTQAMEPKAGIAADLEKRFTAVAAIACTEEEIRMMIAAFYDIHANLPALEAALQAARKVGADKVVVGGDIAAGPLPADTLDILMALGDWVVALQGASDRALVNCYDLLMAKHHSELDAFDPLVRWAAGRITRHQRDYLHDLPAEARFLMQDLGEVYFYPSMATPGQRIPPGGEVIVVGNGHRQGKERQDGRLIVHPGSIGMPEGDQPGAYWAFLGEDVELRRTEYDYHRAARRVVRCGMPDAKAWADRYVLCEEARS